METSKTIAGTTEAWENGTLGQDAAHAKKADLGIESKIDDSLGLQMISIRLPKGVIETYKMLAKVHGTGYQPLMRDALCRFAESELKQILIATVEAQREVSVQSSADEDQPLQQAA